MPSYTEGRLSIFPIAPVDDPARTLNRILEYIGAPTVHYATRSREVSRDWECIEAGDIASVPGDDEIGREIPITNLARHLDLPKCLSAYYSFPPLGKRVFEALRQSIPEKVFGDHLPSEVILKIGEHDLIGADADYESCHIARPFVSLTLWGYHSPPDIDVYKKAVLSTPEILRLKTEVEEIFGSSDLMIYFL
jgi:hypothetical protein